MALDDKAFNKLYFSSYIWRKLSLIREQKQITLLELASKAWVSSHWNIANILNWRVSWSLDQLQKIADAMGVTAKEFEKMVIEAKKAEIEHSQGVRVKNDVDWEELDEDFALKSMVHGNPAALEEAKAVMQWIRQKYNIK